jgi:sulfur relay protein TusC/DsrF
MAQILVVVDADPYAGWRATETLDLALAALAFEHEVSVLFVGSGVHCLVPAQRPHDLALRDVASGFRALLAHGVTRVGAAERALRDHGLSSVALSMPVARLDDAGCAHWLREAEVVLGG